MNATINISLPKSMYQDAKLAVKKQRYASISELIRDGLRNILYQPKLTTNGFTPEFEDMVLKASNEPIKNDIILKTDKEIDDFFLNLKIPSKTKARNVKNSI